MQDWKRSITLRLSVAFALLATVVFAALGLYFSRAADAHMAELDAHDLFGKLALIGHVGEEEEVVLKAEEPPHSRIERLSKHSSFRIVEETLLVNKPRDPLVRTDLPRSYKKAFVQIGLSTGD